MGCNQSKQQKLINEIVKRARDGFRKSQTKINQADDESMNKKASVGNQDQVETPTFDEKDTRKQLETKSEAELEIILAYVQADAKLGGTVYEVLQKSLTEGFQGMEPQQKLHDPTKMKVCIIGAGLSGLIAARVLENDYNVHIYEATDHIGGLWHYSPETDDTIPDADLFKSMYGSCMYGIYETMKVNLPGPISKFSDFKDFEYSCNMPHYSEVMDYINTYYERFNLSQYTTFNTLVNKVIQIENGTKFEVELKPLQGEVTTEIYDYIVIANGHHSVPIIPSIPGLDTFDGSITHTHNFRTLEKSTYDNKTTLIIGGKFSAWDIFEEIATKTDYEKLVVVLRSDGFFKCPDPEFLSLIEQGKVELIRSPLVKVSGNEVFFEDETQIEVDNIIVATGFKYSFPFMPELEINDEGVPLDWYKGTIWLKNPRVTMAGALAYAAFVKAEISALIIRHVWAQDDFDLTPLRQASDKDIEKLNGPRFNPFVGFSLLGAMKSLGVEHDSEWFEYACGTFMSLVKNPRMNMWKSKERWNQKELL